MQNIERTNPEIIELTDAELDAINGGSILGAIGHFFSSVGHAIAGALHGPGDLRRPLDSPK